MNELNHGAGKGDKERSPGWRKNYSEIKGMGTAGFFRQVRVGLSRKTYPASRAFQTEAEYLRWAAQFGVCS